MKFIITESKLSNLIDFFTGGKSIKLRPSKISDKLEQIMLKYLDNQDFQTTEIGKNIFFVNSIDDKYSKIRYDKHVQSCYVEHDLVLELSSFFSIDDTDDILKIISKWVQSTIGMKVHKSVLLYRTYGLEVQ